MILTLKIPDDTYEQYAAYNKADPKAAISTQLTRFRGIDPTSRILILPKEERGELERLLGTDLESAQQLVKLVRNILALKVGAVEVELLPDEASRIADQARFHGIDPNEYLREKARWAIAYVAGA